MDDSEIIRLFNCRNERAVAETTAKYGAYCCKIAFNILEVKEDAEECVNDTFLAAWNSIPPAELKCLRVFIGRITRNISVSRLRKLTADKRGGNAGVMLSELEDIIPSPDNAEREADRAELSEIISDWLDSLDGINKALFVRRYWHGDSISTLAKEYGCKPEQMTQKMLRLRRKLRKHLESEGVTI